MIGIQLPAAGPATLILLDEEGLPMTAEVVDTVTDDDRIPRAWTVSIDSAGNLSIQPASWQVDGFWQTYWGGPHPSTSDWGPWEARRRFDLEIAGIIEELGA